MSELVDWDLALATSKALAKSGPAVTLDQATSAVSELRRLTDVAQGHVSAFTGLTSTEIHAPIKVVDRAEWLATNVTGLRLIADPALARLTGATNANSVGRRIAAKATALQAGTVLAYLAGRVLGQYDVLSSNPGQLLLVAQNIVDAEQRLMVEPRDFRLWVCLHEVTHRTQFTAVPWLRDHFLGEIQAFVEAGEAERERAGAGEDVGQDARDTASQSDRFRRAIATIADAIRNPQSRSSVLDLVQTPSQRKIVDRLTGLMTLLEGHAEFVMDGVGPEVVPSVALIRQRFNARRRGRNAVERAIRRLLGIEVKMRQYAEGRRFVGAVIDQVGMAKFNTVWASPAMLPTLQELANPNEWIERTS